MAKIKPGTPHPNRKGLVMGKNGRYVAKSTYAKQVKAAKTSVSKPAAKSAPRALPPAGQSGGSQRRFQAQDKAAKAARGTQGTGTRTGGTSNLARSSALTKVSRLARGAKGLGAAGLAISGLATAKDLADSLQRGEGYARVFKQGNTQGPGTKGGQGGSRASATRKPKPTAKPKREVTSRNRRGRPTSYAKPVKPAKRGMSNIPPKEGTGKGSPNDKKPVRQNVTPKASKPTVKPKVKAKANPQTSGVGPVKSGRAYSVGASGKNPYRMPQGEERKDKSYKALQELKGSVKASKQRQNAQMPKKPAAKKKLSKNAQNLRRRRGM